MTLFNRIRDSLVQFKEFVRRLYHWLPVLWNDRDYDYSFFYHILRFKLKRMAAHLREHNILLYTERYARQIDYAVFLLDRIIADDYCASKYAAHQEKWGDVSFDKRLENDGTYSLDIYVTKARESGLDEQEAAEFRTLSELKYRCKENDLDRLFRHIRKYHQRWWD